MKAADCADDALTSAAIIKTFNLSRELINCLKPLLKLTHATKTTCASHYQGGSLKIFPLKSGETVKLCILSVIYLKRRSYSSNASSCCPSTHKINVSKSAWGKNKS